MAERTFILLEHVKQDIKENLNEYTQMITITPPPWTDLQKVDFESQVDLLKENLASWMQYIEKIEEQIKRMRNEDETKQPLLEQIDDWKINGENCALLKKVKQAIFKTSKYASLKTVHDTPNVGNVPPPLVPIKYQAQNIQKFHGDYLNWKPFWQRFNLNIHSQDYSNVEKLDALYGLLEGKALQEIQGFSIIDENYHTVIDTLTKRFGNDERIIFELQNQLSAIPPAKPNARSICHTVQSIHNMCRQLQNHGVNINNSTLKLDIIRKMPIEQQAELVLLSQTDPDTTTEGILAKMKEYELKAEIHTQIQKETSYASARNESSKSNTPPRSPTKRFSCSFCNGSHFSSDCQRFSSVEDKIKELKNTSRCTKCTGKNHTSEKCFANIVCRKCNGKHYTFLCNPKGNTKSSNNKQSSAFVTVEKQQGCLLAKEINVMNPTTNTTAKAVAFFDSGSQRTYVSNKLIEQLKLPTLYKEHISIQGIGGKETYYESKFVQLRIKTNDDDYQEIFANSMKSIATSIPVIEINDIDPQSYIVKDKTPDILIGMDYFFKFITSVKQSNGTFFVESLVGQMVAGKVPVTEDTQSETKVTSLPAISTSEKPTSESKSRKPKTCAGGGGFARQKYYSMADWWKLHETTYGSFENKNDQLILTYDRYGALLLSEEEKPD